MNGRESPESEGYAEKVETTDGVYVVPAFTGLGAPYWDQEARGAVFGLTRGTTKSHFIRATLESLAYRTRDVVDAMNEDAGLKTETMRVDGGASMNDFLMQFQSDILDVDIQRSKVMETTALGAAYLAGLATGYFKDQEEIKAKWEEASSFQPNMDEERREDLYAGWQAAVESARTFKFKPKKVNREE